MLPCLILLTTDSEEFIPRSWRWYLIVFRFNSVYAAVAMVTSFRVPKALLEMVKQFTGKLVGV